MTTTSETPRGSMKEATKGPWWSTEPNGFGTIHIRAAGTTPAPIAEVLHFGPDGAAANAKLIAAAPDLLAALMDLPLIALEKDWPDEVAAARAAIQRAADQ